MNRLLHIPKTMLGVLTFCLILVGDVSAQTHLPVIPYPQEVKLERGQFELKPNQTALQVSMQDSSQISVALADLRALFQLQSVSGSANKRQTISLGIPAENEQFADLCKRKKIWPQDRIGEEGYVLLIEKDQIAIAANTAQGLFYGAQTLKQLVRAWQESGKLRCMQIVDWPQYRYRGMQDDISRGPVPTLDYMKMQVRRCAELKLNMISYYIEHVVATESHPAFAPAGGAVTIEQWRELSEYAKPYFVEVVGNFQSFSHFEKVLSSPRYAHLGEASRLLSPAFEESYELLESVYTEMAPAFSSHFFNVNCDETWDLGRGASKPMVDSLGIAEVYLRHILRLYDIVSGLDKRMMMWGDIATSHPEMLKRIPKETVIMGWDYGANESFDHLITPLKEAGFDFFVVPGVLNSNRIMPDYQMAKTNIRNFARNGVEHGALGLLNTVWDDGGFALFSRDWLGVAYAAEKSWNLADKLDDHFDARFDEVVYGDQQNRISQAVMQLTKLTDLGVTHEMNEAVFWQTIIPERGAKLKVDLRDWEQVDAICDTAAQLLSQATPTQFKQELEVWDFTIAQYRYMSNLRRKILKAAGAYRTAILTQLSDRVQARRQIVSALNLVSEVLSASMGLRNQYRALWLHENKTYWLDRNLEQYDGRIIKLNHMQDLLFDALDDFDKGHVLPPPNAVRLDISEASGQYFQYWLVVGPFPNPDRKSYDTDFLVDIGGESKARGKVAGQFQGPDGETYRWQKVSFPTFAECDLTDVFEQDELVIAYAYARIRSPKAQKVRATFGSNDGIKLFLNGELLFEYHDKRNLMPDENEVWLPLVEGNNHLMLKIDQGRGGWGFSFRLPDNAIRNHKYKYTIIK